MRNVSLQTVSWQTVPLRTVRKASPKATVKTEYWPLSIEGKTYDVQVSFKKMKTVRLRVVAGGQIRLSAPQKTSRQWLEQFLADRGDWIAAHVEKMSQKKEAVDKLPPLTATERKEALAYLQPMVDQWYAVVAAYGVARPHVTVRRMRTRYGSCSVGRSRITLSHILLSVPRVCAEYVVLHELAHFLYPNHSRQFYQFIEMHMPDWKERERMLKQS